MKGVFFALFVVCICTVAATAQVTRFMQNGNDYYTKGKYKEAAETYARALAKNPNYTPGLFNLGNSLYSLKKYDSSRKVMEATEKVAGNKEGKAAANYNIGNSYMAERKWDEAISAYKKTLRNNPADADAKYNLSYAEKMKAQEQQQQKQDKKDDKKDKKEKQDQQNKDNKDKNDDQNKNDPNKDDKDKKEDKQQQPQQQQSNISKQTAEQLLNALQNEEKKLQEKMRKEKGVPVRPDKDW